MSYYESGFNALNFNSWSYGMFAMSIDGSVIYLITGNSNNFSNGSESNSIYKSTNYGVNWQAIENTARSWGQIRCSSNGTTVVASTQYAVYYSINSGSSWNSISVDYPIFSLCINTDGTYWGIGSNQNPFHYTINYGSSFSTTTNSYTNVITMCCCNSTGQYVYFINNSKVHYSNDNGNSFIQRSLNINGRNITCSSDGSIIACSNTNNAVYISTNYGSDWSSEYYAYSNIRFGSLHLSNDGSILFACCDGNYNSYSSNANSGSVSILTTNGSNGNINLTGFSWRVGCLSGDGSFFIAIDNFYKAYSYKSTYQSATNPITYYTSPIKTLNPSNSNWSSGMLAMSNTGSVIYLINGNSKNNYQNANKIWKSTDYGATWATLSNSQSSNGWGQIRCSSDGTIVVATTQYNIYYSNNSGNTWSSFLDVGYPIYSLCINSNGTYWGLGSNGTFLYTTTSSSPSSTSSTEWGGPIYSSCCSSSGKYVYLNSNGGPYFSNNYGASFKNLSLNSDFQNITCNSNGSIVVCSNDSGIYISVDFGINWSEPYYMSGNIRNYSLCLSNDGSRLFACSDSHTMSFSTNVNNSSVTILTTNGSGGNISFYSFGSWIVGCLSGDGRVFIAVESNYRTQACLTPTFTSGYNASIISTNPILWYYLNNVTTTLGLKNNGTAGVGAITTTGTITVSTSGIGGVNSNIGSLQFNGSSSNYLTIPSIPANTFDFTGLTIMFWMRANNPSTSSVFDFAASASSTNSNIRFSNYSGGSSTNAAYVYSTSTSSSSIFTWSTNDGGTNAVWRHVCWTLTPSIVGTNNSRWNLYLNGYLVNTTSNGYYPDPSIVRSSNFIGKDNSGNSFKGYICDFRIYKGVALQTDIFNAMTNSINSIGFLGSNAYPYNLLTLYKTPNGSSYGTTRFIINDVDIGYLCQSKVSGNAIISSNLKVEIGGLPKDLSELFEANQ